MNSLRRLAPRLMPLAMLLTWPSTACAHLVVKGIGEIGNGALHPLVTPAHILIMLGLAILLGRRIPLDLKWPLGVLSGASAAALCLTTTGWPKEVSQTFLIALALVIATLVVLEIQPSREILIALCAAVGIGIGLDSGLETGSTAAIAKSLLGTWFTLNALTGYLALCISNGANQHWARIAMRVVASWIIAISLLVLAFSLRK